MFQTFRVWLTSKTTHIACGLAFLTPLMLVMFRHFLPTWITICALVALGGVQRRRLFKTRPSLLWTLPLGLCILWMLASAFWAPDLAKVFSLVIKLLGMLGAGVILCLYFRQQSKEHMKKIMGALCWGMGTLSLWLALESSLGVGLRYFLEKGHFAPSRTDALLYYNSGITGLCLILWPVLWLISRWRSSVAVTIFLCVIPFFMTFENHVSPLALMTGALFFALTYLFQKKFIYVFSAIVFVGMVGSPQITLRYLQPEKVEQILPQTAKGSYIHRLWIWRYVAHRALEKPFLGWGLESSRDIELKQGLLWGSEKFCFPYGGKIPYEGCANEAIPLHPHNVALQLWLELGAVGAVLFSFLFCGGLLWIAHLPISRSLRASMVSAFTCALVISTISFGFWQSKWVMTMIVTALLLHVMRRFERSPQHGYGVITV
ncbi:MAG: O-antigen ligase family protein [Alphaproteobacteria bacterium]|jgi:O-antigen ligase|nr:O-antigen ligase family protein [Alphaproteobacteria bacterium]